MQVIPTIFINGPALNDNVSFTSDITILSSNISFG